MLYDSQVYGLRGVSGILTSAKYMVYGRRFLLRVPYPNHL